MYSETEMRARYEILLEEYSKVVNIEGLTMVDMVKKDYTPAISDIQRNLCDTILAKKAVSDKIPCKAETVSLERISALADRIFDANSELENALNSVPQGTALEVAQHYRHEVVSRMAALRALVDEIEAHSDREFWPVPSYGDIIFSIK